METSAICLGPLRRISIHKSIQEVGLMVDIYLKLP